MNKKKDNVISKLLSGNRKYFKDFFSKVWEIIVKPEMLFLPGDLAFSIMLSIVPIISIVSAISASFGLTVNDISEILGKIFTNIKFDLIIPNILEQPITLKYISVICIMFYVASNGATSIIIASNQIYGIKQSTYFKRKLKAIFMTMLLCILYIFVLLVPLLGNKIISSFDYFNIKNIINPILTIVRGPITWLIIYFFVKSIYVIAPDKEVDTRGINLGAIFTTLFWVLATYLYSGYINNFTAYDKYYGSLSGIAILMLWIYWLCFIFVIGLCLNVKVENNEMEKTGIIKEVNK